MRLLFPADAPRLPLRLGLAGLAPFVATALGVWWAPPAWQALVAAAFLAYGAVILSFLGGIHWGLAMGCEDPANPTFRRRVVASMAPSLIAWPGLLWGGLPGTLVVMLGFLVVRGFEASPAGALGLPGWYRRLRNLLTAVVVACHLLVIARLWTGP